jgi:hypothetical protein
VVGKPSKVHTNDHAPTLDEAKAQFESGLAALAGVGEAAGNAIAARARRQRLTKTARATTGAGRRPVDCHLADRQTKKIS